MIFCMKFFLKREDNNYLVEWQAKEIPAIHTIQEKIMKENLILLHGALGSKSQFNELTKILAENYEVHRLDFEGHGEHRGCGDFKMETFVRNILDFMQAKKLEKSNFFGYSMGGYVVLSLAAKNPEKVGNIVTLATKLDWNPKIAEREKASLQVDKIEEKVPHFAEMLNERHHNWREVVRKTSEMMIRLGDTEAIPTEVFTSINNRTLLCVGENDKMVSIEECKKVVEKLPNGKLEILADTPHPLEKIEPERLAGIISAFIDQV